MSRAAANDSLIVYGGIGFVKGAWQPETSRILSAKTGPNAALRRDLGIAVENHATKSKFHWSPFRVAVTTEDVVAAIKSKNPDWTDRFPDVSDIRDHFEAVYALVLIPTYEARILSSGGTSDVAVDNEHLLVWTSAVLVELGTGEIEISATAAHETVAATSAGQSSFENISTHFKTLIEKSSIQAIDRLSKLSAIHSPGDEFPVMFTGAIVTDSAARKLYGFGQPEKAKRKNVCTMPSECQNENCGKLIALLANGVAAAMTANNVPVLPPVGLNSWGERATDRVALNLTLPRGARHFEREITIAVGAESADTKLVAIVTKLRFEDTAGKSKYTRKRYYTARTRVRGFETDPDDCRKLISKPRQTNAAAVALPATLIDGAPDHLDLHRAKLLMALYRSLLAIRF